MGKKSKSKGGDGTGTPKEMGQGKITDGLKPCEMSRAQLLGFILRLQVELEKEREERNYYMLEREKMFQTWNLLLEQIAYEKEKSALFSSHVDDAQAAKDGEDALYEQKLRFLKQEHTRSLGSLRLHHLTLMKHAQDENWALIMIMRETLIGKKKEIRQAQMAFYQTIRGLYWKHAKDVSDLRADLAGEIRRLETSFDRRLFEGQDKLEEVQEKLDISLQKTKEAQVHTLIESHRYQAKELTVFFRDLIRHNLGLIYGMKDAAKKEKTLELRARKDYDTYKQRYEMEVAPAIKWKKELELWQIEDKDEDVEQLKKELRDANEQCRRIKYTSRMVESSNETLQQRIAIAIKERDKLRQEFGKSIIDVQKRKSMHRFIQEIKRKGAKREGDLYHILAEDAEMIANGEEMEPGWGFAAMMCEKEGKIEELKEEISQLANGHGTIEKLYKDEFLKNEINLADVGFPVKGTGFLRGVFEEDLELDGEADEAEEEGAEDETEIEG